MKKKKYSREYLNGFMDAIDVISRCIDSQRDAFGRRIIPKEILQDIDDQVRRVCTTKFADWEICNKEKI